MGVSDLFDPRSSFKERAANFRGTSELFPGRARAAAAKDRGGDFTVSNDLRPEINRTCFSIDRGFTPLTIVAGMFSLTGRRKKNRGRQSDAWRGLSSVWMAIVLMFQGLAKGAF